MSKNSKKKSSKEHSKKKEKKRYSKVSKTGTYPNIHQIITKTKTKKTKKKVTKKINKREDFSSIKQMLQTIIEKLQQNQTDEKVNTSSHFNNAQQLGDEITSQFTHSFSTWQEAIKYLTETISRDHANELLKTYQNRKKLFEKTGQIKIYETFRNEEIFHCLFVRKCMDILNKGEAKNLHDWSKDELYFFVHICHYLLNFPVPNISQYNIEHWQTEKHHPEYENTNSEKITESDIIEMCVDRLSRNLQYNEGDFNISQLDFYEPKFLYDHISRIHFYKENLETLKPIILKLWKKEKSKQNQTKLSDLIWEKIRNI